MDIGCYSLQNSLSPVEVRFVSLIPLVDRRSSFRTLNQVKSALHYRQSHTQSRTIIALLAIILTLLIFIFYRQIIRAWIRSYLFRRNGLQSSASNSNFNHRYQLLTSVVVDDAPGSSSNIYSNGRNTPVSSSSSSYGGRLRSVWKDLFIQFFIIFFFFFRIAFSLTFYLIYHDPVRKWFLSVAKKTIKYLLVLLSPAV